jgi:hypothetical protein
MGFKIDEVLSGDTRTVGDLEIEFFGPDHTRGGTTDEWDTTAYVVRHLGGLGVFASNVDIPFGANLRAALAAERARDQQPVVFIGMMVQPFLETPAEEPEANHHLARKAQTRDAQGDFEAYRQGQAFAPMPGEVIVLRDGAVQVVEPRAPFLESPPGLNVVLPFSNREAELQEPVTGRKNFDVSRKAELEQELRRLAEHMYGGPLFRIVLSLARDLQGQQRTFAMIFVIDEEGSEWIYEYRPRSCDFVQVQRTSEEARDYLSAMLIWATDFLAVATGEVEPRVLTRSVLEDRANDVVPKFVDQLWNFYHPLRFPRQVLTQYRRALAAEAATACSVFPRPAATHATLSDNVLQRTI